MNLALSKNIWNIVLVSNEFIFQLINSTGVYYRPIPRRINTKVDGCYNWSTDF